MMFKPSGDVNMRLLDNIASWITKLGLSSHKPKDLPYNQLVVAFSKVGRLDDAVAWTEKMVEQGLDPSREAFVELMLANALARDSAASRRWFDSMALAGVPPDLDACNAVLRSFAESADPSGAKEWLDNMEAEGFTPDRTSRYMMLMSNIKAADMKKAHEWLGHMEKHGDWKDSKDSEGLITAYVETGALEEAFDAAKVVVPGATRTAGYHVWTTLLRALASSPQPDVNLAEEVLREMRRCGFVPGRLPMLDLVHVLGQERCESLCNELGIDSKKYA